MLATESRERAYEPGKISGVRSFGKVGRLTIEHGINFLAELYQPGIGYSTLNAARCALSTIWFTSEPHTFGQYTLVCRFIKGIFECRPSLPRYQETWDVTVVLEYLAKLGPPEKLSVQNLTLKVVMMMVLLSGQRRQMPHTLSIDCMQLSADKHLFFIKSLLKTSRPGKHLACIEFQAYLREVSLCIVKHLQQYLKRTDILRGDVKELLVSYNKPHKAVSPDTVSRWIKSTLVGAGIDTSKYSAHSTRSASTSPTKGNSISMPQL